MSLVLSTVFLMAATDEDSIYGFIKEIPESCMKIDENLLVM